MDKVKNLILGVIVVLVLILGFLGGRGYQKRQISPSELYLLDQIELLQEELDNYQNEYNFLEEEKNSLQEQVLEYEKALKDLQKGYHEKVTTVTSYSNAELERFFSDRYGS